MKNKLSEHMKKIGAAGGTATKTKYGSEHFKKLGEKGQKALRKKIEKDV